MAEQTIAEKLIGLRDADNVKEMKKFEQELKKIEQSSSIELSKKQKEALEKIGRASCR